MEEKKVTTMDLSWKKLTLISSEIICMLTNLNTLKLNDNKLTTLPKEISQLISLVNLDISSNYFSILPECLCALTNLNTLNLHENRLTTLPKEISQLNALVSLDISSNYFSILPDSLWTLTNLQNLSIRDNHIIEIPDVISNLILLDTLDVEYNEIETFPSTIWNIKNLYCLEEGLLNCTLCEKHFSYCGSQITTKCNHTFHKRCLSEYLYNLKEEKKIKRCPICSDINFLENVELDICLFLGLYP